MSASLGGGIHLPKKVNDQIIQSVMKKFARMCRIYVTVFAGDITKKRGRLPPALPAFPRFSLINSDNGPA
jgi:hypothetical protein